MKREIFYACNVRTATGTGSESSSLRKRLSLYLDFDI